MHPLPPLPPLPPSPTHRLAVDLAVGVPEECVGEAVLQLVHGQKGRCVYQLQGREEGEGRGGRGRRGEGRERGREGSGRSIVGMLLQV